MKSEQEIRERLELLEEGAYGDGAYAHNRIDTLRWVLDITTDARD